MSKRMILALMVTFLAATATASASVLPNGWTVTPAGTLTTLGTLPLHMALDPTGKWIAVTNSGYATEGVAIVSAATGQVAARATLAGSFYGIAFSPDGRTLYVSTAAKSGIHRFAFDAASGALSDLGEWTVSAKNVWIAGVAVSPDGKTVYAAGGYADALYALDATTGAARFTAHVGHEPYGVVVTHDGSRAFVSDWIGGSVSVVSTADGKVVATIPVGAHPNAMALANDGATLFVACANGASVDEIDVAAAKVVARLSAALWPDALEGVTPNGIALAAGGHTVFVADADDDALAAIDVSSGRVVGAVPVGWYATDVAVSRDGRWLFALDGKGTSGHPNPRYQHPDATAQEDDSYYDGTLAVGDLERIPMPDKASLASGMRTVIANVPAAEATPAVLSTIHHVIYAIKENRTYDEVLGDDPRGNGMASLAIFGKRITPNIHRLADDFVLLDDFDVDSTVSADGHNWADAAFATDYVQKLWPSNYSGRGRGYEFEGDEASLPPSGYLWDDAAASGASFRDYGEFVQPFGHPEAKGLVGRIDARYPGWDLKISDQARMDEWTREFDAYDRNGGLPALEMVYLPDDHTSGVAPGARTPYAYLASNDYAVGRLVDRLSRSRYWKDTVLFVVEDDAQAGPDHVDDQRAEAIVAGGPVRRGFVDHTHYTQCSVLATIEAILHLHHMSQFDAVAKLMTADFTAQPDLRPWTDSPPEIPLGATNPKKSQNPVTMLDLRRPDAVDPAVMNRILLDYARAHAGSHSPS